MRKPTKALVAGIMAVGFATAAQAPAHADGRLDEGRFMVVTSNSPDSAKPFGARTTGPQMLRFGYRACAELDRHPASAVAATQALYGQRTNPEWARQQVVFYAAQYLCERHWDRYKSTV
ncbi:DUF732 domain-containing protein [Tsukamurella sp. PLM1]|uniref:DUF732 domain-containing protein n=1 Tax=Tsukamurella sp. PLM1 TaxID=2929795 RepID=UPI0020481508|nr:DUF732 domain-containing protein [Tsukamurella sp. PLM1]BDH59017.1 hypothetical protein MTP03_39560 [Tsukamurella sp. PLM1]